ncbi:MAG: hypothetical protein AMXMBFR83_20180 [Phycisphaerae bacterium]|jgi:hypothetical protein
MTVQSASYRAQVPGVGPSLQAINGRPGIMAALANSRDGAFKPPPDGRGSDGAAHTIRRSGHTPPNTGIDPRRTGDHNTTRFQA